MIIFSITAAYSHHAFNYVARLIQRFNFFSFFGVVVFVFFAFAAKTGSLFMTVTLFKHVL